MKTEKSGSKIKNELFSEKKYAEMRIEMSENEKVLREWIFR